MAALLVILMVAATVPPAFLIRGDKNSVPLLLVWMAMLSGLAGSSMAALRSALDRRAQGFEDKNGNQWPDPYPRTGK